jgi:predicted amidohydrolase
MQDLRIALIQTNLHWENISENLNVFDRKIETIEAVDLIILPEMFSTAFSMNTSLAETMDGGAVDWMRKKASEKNCVLTGSLMIQENENFYNRLIWMRADGTFETYDKRHLFSLSKEPKIFTAGENRLQVNLKGWEICPLICYDLRFPVWSRNRMPYYDVLLYVANWPERRNMAWKTLLQARAIENQSYVIGVNRTGNDGAAVYHSGDSMVIDTLGNVLYHQTDDEAIYTFTLNYEELQKTRTQLPFLKDAD